MHEPAALTSSFVPLLLPSNQLHRDAYNAKEEEELHPNYTKCRGNQGTSDQRNITFTREKKVMNHLPLFFTPDQEQKSKAGAELQPTTQEKTIISFVRMVDVRRDTHEKQLFTPFTKHCFGCYLTENR